MRVKQIISQNRRDFRAIFECEHCKFELERSGYDDRYFHYQVVPSLKCPECGKTADKKTYRPLDPKYPEGTTI